MRYRIAYIREQYSPFVIQRRILWGLLWYDVDSYFDRRQAERVMERLNDKR